MSGNGENKGEVIVFIIILIVFAIILLRNVVFGFYEETHGVPILLPFLPIIIIPLLISFIAYFIRKKKDK